MAELKKRMAQYAELDKPFVCFWRPQDANGFMGQWFEASMTDPESGNRFNCCEQWMMWSKAQLFGDYEVARTILNTPSPKKQKALGRKVKNWDEDKWLSNRDEIVYRGNVLKFTQNADLREQLVRTHPHVLVEASPLDTIWGIGLAESDPKAHTISQWRGLNLLGIALMRVRHELVAQGGAPALPPGQHCDNAGGGVDGAGQEEGRQAVEGGGKKHRKQKRSGK